MTGVFDGKFGTKRFCSSKDWGTYCEYIDRPGDVQVRKDWNLTSIDELSSELRGESFKGKFPQLE